MMRTALQLVLWLAQLRSATLFKLSSVTSPFNNTLLVIHCRMKVKGLDANAVCREREPLYDGYRKYFREVYYLTHRECKAGDPHLCLTKLMKGRGAHRDGVFYMHFDSLIRPRNLGPSFDSTKMFSFDERTWCEINQTDLSQEHCICAWWSPARARGYQDAIEHLRNSNVPAFENLDPWEFWIGNDDMFYVPNSLYGLYDKLANAFVNVHHEVAGPSMRSILENLTSTPMLSMSCTGSCCSHLLGEVALEPDFRCGHAFDLSVNETREAFPTAISTYRDVIPLKAWRQVMKQALE